MLVMDETLTVVVRDPHSKQVLGGVIGRTSLGLLFLDLLYLPASLRGRGLGSQILDAFEEEGRRRGWRTFGEIGCNPAGSSRIFMSKNL